jgi:hypothetical protein
VVCGCSVKCADDKDFQGSLGKFVAAYQNDFSQACKEIEKALLKMEEQMEEESEGNHASRSRL